jgi:hypothetical protein
MKRTDMTIPENRRAFERRAFRGLCLLLTGAVVLFAIGATLGWAGVVIALMVPVCLSAPDPKF